MPFYLHIVNNEKCIHYLYFAMGTLFGKIIVNPGHCGKNDSNAMTYLNMYMFLQH
jgi:hypothetical protein